MMEPEQPVSISPANLERAVRDAVHSIADDPAVRRLIKETVLLTLVEIESQRDRRAVEVFLRECERRKVIVRAAEDGRLMVTGADRLGADLKAVLTVYRDQIFEYLARERKALPALRLHKAGG